MAGFMYPKYKNRSFLKRNAVNILITGLLLILLINRMPSIIGMFQKESDPFPPFNVQNLSGESVALPLSQKQVMVFWATWCGPCKLELYRINRMIEKGEIPPDSVFAISIGETSQVVASHVEEHKYKFRVGLDPEANASRILNIAGTPTIMLVNEKGITEWMTMGISPSLELRITNFLTSGM